MLEQNKTEKIEELVKEFFEKMTMPISEIEVSYSVVDEKSVIDLTIKTDEPQILIGQQGQTLFEIQKLLRTVLNKKMLTSSDDNNSFYLNLDINDYKKQKIDYLKYLAKESADWVSSKKEEKILLPMSSYERRIIHSELSKRDDIITESKGFGSERHIVIKPK